MSGFRANEAVIKNPLMTKKIGTPGKYLSGALNKSISTPKCDAPCNITTCIAANRRIRSKLFFFEIIVGIESSCQNKRVVVAFLEKQQPLF
jgi:hypothetical protein